MEYNIILFIIVCRGSYIGWRKNNRRRKITHNGRYILLSVLKFSIFYKYYFIHFLTARRRAAAKKKKLKNLGKSKSTDTEEEEADEDVGDDGEKQNFFYEIRIVSNRTYIILKVICLFVRLIKN